jgi:hypothetical protein
MQSAAIFLGLLAISYSVNRLADAVVELKNALAPSLEEQTSKRIATMENFNKVLKKME